MSLWDRLRHNLGLKLLSLLAAVVIWGTVQTQTDPLSVRRKTLKIVPINVPQNLAPVSVEPAQMTLTLVGRASAFHRLEESNPRLAADVARGAVGSYNAFLRPDDLPAGLAIKDMARRTAMVELDNLESATRPVFVEVRGYPEPGFAATKWQARPNEVALRGPSSLLRRVSRVVAEVDVSGLTTSLTAPVSLTTRDAANLVMSGVMLEPTQTTVTVSLRQVNSKTVPVAPVITTPAPGYEIAAVRVVPAVVTVTGAAPAVSALEALQTAPVDLRGVRQQTTVSASLRVPAGCRVLGAAAVRITVTLRAGSSFVAPGSATEPPSEESRAPEGEDTPRGAAGSAPPDADVKPGAPTGEDRP